MTWLGVFWLVMAVVNTLLGLSGIRGFIQPIETVIFIDIIFVAFGIMFIAMGKAK